MSDPRKSRESIRACLACGYTSCDGCSGGFGVDGTSEYATGWQGAIDAVDSARSSEPGTAAPRSVHANKKESSR